MTKYNVYMKEDLKVKVKDKIKLETTNSGTMDVNVPSGIELNLNDKKNKMDYLLLILPSLITIIVLVINFQQFKSLDSLNTETKELYESQIVSLNKEIDYWTQTVEVQQGLLSEQIRATTLNAMYSISAQIIENPSKSDIVLKGIHSNIEMVQMCDESSQLDQSDSNYPLYQQVEAMKDAAENYVFDNIKIYVTELYHENQLIRRNAIPVLINKLVKGNQKRMLDQLIHELTLRISILQDKEKKIDAEGSFYSGILNSLYVIRAIDLSVYDDSNKSDIEVTADDIKKLISDYIRLVNDHVTYNVKGEIGIQIEIIKKDFGIQ